LRIFFGAANILRNQALTSIRRSSVDVPKKANIRNSHAGLPVTFQKRQRQPSLDQFLPSHDLTGAWMPARASKRLSSNRTDVNSLAPSIAADCVARDCQPSPPRAQPVVSDHSEHLFSLTLSLGSNTDDECCKEDELEQQVLDSHELRVEYAQHLRAPALQLPRHPMPQANRCTEYFKPEQSFHQHDAASAEICVTGLEPVALPVHAASWSIASSSTTSLNGTVASLPSSYLPGSHHALSPISSCHSIADSRVVALLSCSTLKNQSEHNIIQYSDAANVSPHLAAGHIVLGMFVVHPCPPHFLMRFV
jgi:hypothetical protein